MRNQSKGSDQKGRMPGDKQQDRRLDTAGIEKDAGRSRGGKNRSNSYECMPRSKK